jgi:ribosomal protein S18 acetylase RimI-like enzyme
MHVAPMKPDQLNEVAAFITRLQADPSHHIGYFGERQEDIALYVRELEPAGTDCFVLAHEDEKLLGILGAEADPELRRAWLHGPIVDYPDWDTLADHLYEAACQQVIPAYASMYELFGNIANVNLCRFARRWGFAPLPSTAAVLRFPRHQGVTLPAAHASELDSRFHDSFIKLHETSFPDAYYLGKQVIGMLNDTKKVFVVTDGDSLGGYIYAQVDSGGDGYIDFLGVEESVRRQGIGRQLITAATHWLLSLPGVQDIRLTVNGDNTPAIALYSGLGYEHVCTLQAYRKAVFADS